MDGFFGIGFGELVMIAIVALIVLGPERLPGALREVAKFIRQIRNLSQEFTSQFGDEFKALEDLNPRRLLQDAIDTIDEEEKSKESAAKTPAAKSTTTTPAAKKPTSSAIKPTTAKNGTAKSTTAASSTTKPVPKVTAATPAKVDGAADATATADSKSNDADPLPENAVAETANPETPAVVEPQPATPTASEAVTTDATSTDTVTVTASEGAPENQIAPPALVASTATVDETIAEPPQDVVQTNGHAVQSSVAASDAGDVTFVPDDTTDEKPEQESSVNAIADAPTARNRQVDGVEV
jgi:sec-independent protein translocase protein TatB